MQEQIIPIESKIHCNREQGYRQATHCSFLVLAFRGQLLENLVSLNNNSLKHTCTLLVHGIMWFSSAIKFSDTFKWIAFVRLHRFKGQVPDD